jgi:hypothetical protein
MWGQEWQNIYKLVQPYPDVHETDVTEEMKKQNWDVKKLFTMAEEFYYFTGVTCCNVRPPLNTVVTLNITLLVSYLKSSLVLSSSAV